MPTDYAGAATYPVTIPVPDDGDAANASSIDPALEGLADRDTAIIDHLDNVLIREDYWEDGTEAAALTVFSTAVFAIGSGAQIDVALADLPLGANVHLTGQFQLELTQVLGAGTTTVELQLSSQLNGGAWAPVVNSRIRIKTTAILVSGDILPVSFNCFLPDIKAAGDYVFRVEGRVLPVDGAPDPTATLYSPGCLRAFCLLTPSMV